LQSVVSIHDTGYCQNPMEVSGLYCGPMSSRERLGFVGLGIMGEPMAGHLAAAGYELTVYDLDAAGATRVKGSFGNVTVARSAAEVAGNSDVVITMLPDGNSVRAVTFGADGLAEGFRSGSLLLDTSSSQPWLTQQTATELAAVGVDMVDAAVSGAQWGAQEADLVFMVGGSPESVVRIAPILSILGRVHFHVGPLSSGHVMKCINNTVTAMTFLATAEGLALGMRCGLDGAAMNSVLNESTGMSWITRNHIEQRILSRSFDDPFRLELMLKDIGIATALAKEQQVPMMLSGLGEELYRAAVAQPDRGESISEIARWVEQQMGTEIR
jgi:3-hydroxyisobutyrate dehydrogenase